MLSTVHATNIMANAPVPQVLEGKTALSRYATLWLVARIERHEQKANVNVTRVGRESTAMFAGRMMHAML